MSNPNGETVARLRQPQVLGCEKHEKIPSPPPYTPSPRTTSLLQESGGKSSSPPNPPLPQLPRATRVVRVPFLFGTDPSMPETKFTLHPSRIYQKYEKMSGVLANPREPSATVRASDSRLIVTAW